MSKTMNTSGQPQVIDTVYFQQFSDAALLLMCFEKVMDAVGVVDEGVKIREFDETYVGLIEASLALGVLFERRTGHDAVKVSADHLEEQRRRLLAGEELKSLLIPVVGPGMAPVPASAFSGLTDLELASAGFNYADRVRLAIAGDSLREVELADARVHSVDAITALSTLVMRLAGGSMVDLAKHASRITGPGSETLQ